MHLLRPIAVLALLVCLIGPAAAQKQPAQQAPQPAPAKPYKPVAIKPPAPVNDPALEAMRKQLSAAPQKKDRAALGKLVISKGFFWERETGDGADKKKSGVDNLAAALGLAGKDSVGWDMLAGYAEDPTVSPAPDRKGALCAPADPDFDGKALEALLDATQTDIGEWGYPASEGIDVHAAPQANAPVTGKLGLHFVRVMPENAPASAAYLRIVTPDGKTGYVSVDALAPIGSDRLCYAKEGGTWKIGGYIGGGEAP
jgi:hypothetical protein